MTDVGADAAVVKLVLLWSDTTAFEGEAARKHTPRVGCGTTVW